MSFACLEVLVQRAVISKTRAFNQSPLDTTGCFLNLAPISLNQKPEGSHRSTAKAKQSPTEGETIAIHQVSVRCLQFWLFACEGLFVMIIRPLRSRDITS